MKLPISQGQDRKTAEKSRPGLRLSNAQFEFQALYKAALNDNGLYIPSDSPMDNTQAGVMVIPICGIISHGIDPDMCEMCGLVSLDELQETLQNIPESISTVVFAFDSPGGTTEALRETSDLIRNLPQKTVAYTSGFMASAAYWLGSACDEIYCAGSSTLGSVGISFERMDVTQANEKAGVVVKHIGSSPRKFWGDPTYPLSDDELNFFQAGVEEEAAEFYASVLQNRTIDQVLLEQAVLVTGDEAVETGFADGIYSTLGELLKDLN